MLLCKNGHYYTGVTTDVESRFVKHQSGKGAKYTRANPPQKIVYQIKVLSEGAAKKLEVKIKKMSRIQKDQLIKSTEKSTRRV